jgi:membrane fusion protein, multidrug efflux system
MNLDKIASLFSLSLVLNACSHDNPRQTTEDLNINRRDTVLVETAIVKWGPFNYIIETNGKVHPARQQDYSTKQSIQITSCNVANNAAVNFEDTLLQFDCREAIRLLKTAELEYFNAQLEFKSDWLGYSKGNVSASLMDTIKQKIEVSSGLSSAKLNLQKAKDEVSSCVVRAPFDGLIANCRISEGYLAKEGEQLFTLYSHKHMYVECKIIESDLGTLRVNDRALITPVFDNKKVFNAKVSEINPIVDDGGLVSIRIRIENPLSMLPGMNVTVKVMSPQEASIIIPKSAIVFRSGKPVAFTIEKNTAKWNYLVLGKENENEVQVLDGLAAGATVIINNNLQLVHDSPVKQSSLNDSLSN